MPKDALIFGITPNYDFALANVLFGLKKYSPRFVEDIIVFHTGLSEVQKLYLNEILPCNFVDYTIPDCYCDINYKNLKVAIEKFSIAAFSRYQAFDMLDQYERVVWLDSDILIQKDITELLHLADKTGLAISQSEELTLNRYNFTKPLHEYDMYKITCNSGTLVFNSILKNREAMTDWCYKTTIDYAEYLHNADQAVFNMLIEHFDITPNFINTNKYVCHPLSPAAETASIIHSWGADKFWNCERYKTLYPEWVENNELWVNLTRCTKNISQKTKNSIPKANPESIRLTVLMTVFNGEDFLCESIDSILAQTYSNFEFLIVIEAGSSKKSVDILQSYIDPRIKLVYNEKRLGLSESLNVGIRLAKGEYIARMDCDDISLPTRLEEQVKFMDDNPSIGVCGTWLQYFDKSGKKNIEETPIDPEIYACRMLFNCSLAHSSLILRKDLLINNSMFYDPNWYIEDHELWARLLEKNICKITNMPRVLLLCRLDESSKTRSNVLKFLDDYRRLMRRQFKNRLDIELSSKELSLCDEMLNPWGHMDSQSKKKSINILLQLHKKMLRANGVKRVFNHEKLKLVLASQIEKHKDINQKSTINRYIKKILKPIAQPILNRITAIVYSATNPLNSCLCSIERKMNQSLNIINQNNEDIDLKIENIYALLEKMETQHKHTHVSLEQTKTALDSYISDANKTARDVHTHVDWVQRDILCVLDNKTNFIENDNIRIKTSYPIAYDSPDHICPIGTIDDYTRHPRFIRACEQHFSKIKKISFLDCGCSAGGIVLDAALRGHIGIGVEGSDISYRQQRADWRLLKNNLFTCDITKPFFLSNSIDQQPYKFDVVSAWEVLEHLTIQGLEGFFTNLKYHMRNDSIFCCSIANYHYGYTKDGKPHHQTVQPRSWWENFIRQQGFVEIKDCFSVQDFARGNNNSPVFYHPQELATSESEIEFLMVLQKA